ncbi:MAG: hypothetical protein JRC93_06665 [Deltaproteobacteria bacterium]|nr:hypothetical protein [Deltaproteobacteria bacterium]
MKKALVILFALGLVFSFTAPVMATDVSFDGSFRVRGWYDSNSALTKNNATPIAYYDQRLRLTTVFKVAEGLSFTTRFDAMDGVWGTTGIQDGSAASDDNLEFDVSYMTFMTGIGQFKAGYMSDGCWGTAFGDNETFKGAVSFLTKLGDNVYFSLKMVKSAEGDNNTTYSDYDDDSYSAAVIYGSEAITAGLLYNYKRYANYVAGINTSLGTTYRVAEINVVSPYVKATFGDLYVESELIWADGKAKWDNKATADTELEGLAFYLMGKYNLGSSYVGGIFAYVQGDDPNTVFTTKSENVLGEVNGGTEWGPTLIMWNSTCPTTLGGATGTRDRMDNASFYQVFAGTTIDKLSLKASLSMAKANENGTGGVYLASGAEYLDKDYGTEFDVTAGYKIYDNLTYSAGFGYLWAGDYYKGASATAEIGNTYLLMNKLQVNF